MPPPAPDVCPAVRRLDPADVAPLAHALTRAFADDPVYRWVHPGEREWARAGPRFFAALLRHFGRWGTVLVPRDGGAVAIWAPPEPRDPGVTARLLLTARLCVGLGRRLPRGVRVAAALEGLRPDERHWYLALLGTAPERQGEGRATRLLAPILARCDASRLPARLETAKLANVGFYARFGFVAEREVCVVGESGLRVFGMRRGPNAAS